MRYRRRVPFHDQTSLSGVELARRMRGQGRRKQALIERLLRFGGDALADDELLDLLLDGLLPEEERATLLAAFYQEFPTTAALLAAPADRLEAMPGVSPALVARLRAIRMLAIRLSSSRMALRPLLKTRSQLLRVCDMILGHLSTEALLCIFVDSRLRLIGHHLSDSGGVSHIPVRPRLLLTRALQMRAAGLILVHNHPSGDPTPSEADATLTRDIMSACRLMDVTFHEHLIVAGGRHFSFREHGLL